MAVDIVTTRPCPAETGGGMWGTGETHSVSDSYARFLIGQGYAYDQSGGLEDVTDYGPDIGALQNPAYRSPQFGVSQRLLAPTRRILANATGMLWPWPCVLTGIEAVALGSSGNVYLDDALAADSNNRLISAAYNAAGLMAGSKYPISGAGTGVLVNTGLYWTAPGGTSAYWVDIIDGTPVPGAEQSGAALAYTLRSASGVAISGSAYVHSLRVVVPGTAGSLVPYVGQAATAGQETGGPSAGYAYTALQANQIIPIGATLDKGLYLTLPTGGIVAVNYLPR